MIARINNGYVPRGKAQWLHGRVTYSALFSLFVFRSQNENRLSVVLNYALESRENDL